jgi:hypothetical protein
MIKANANNTGFNVNSKSKPNLQDVLRQEEPQKVEIAQNQLASDYITTGNLQINSKPKEQKPQRL